jgi:hypothetical protein
MLGSFSVARRTQHHEVIFSLTSEIGTCHERELKHLILEARQHDIDIIPQKSIHLKI